MDRRLRDLLPVLVIPTGYALIARLATGQDLFAVMSVTFLFLVPTVVGFLTGALQPLGARP